MHTIVIWIGFQIVWLASATGAAAGSGLPGILAALVFAGYVLATSPDPATPRIMLASAITGLLAESALVATELVRYAAAWPSLHAAPAWIVMLWLAFGATIAPLERLVGAGRFLRLAVLGALAGPLAYWAGARIGAMTIAEPLWRTYFIIAIIWAIVLPILCAVRSSRRAPPTHGPRDKA